MNPFEKICFLYLFFVLKIFLVPYTYTLICKQLVSLNDKWEYYITILTFTVFAFTSYSR